jgi:hypothetical protein
VKRLTPSSGDPRASRANRHWTPDSGGLTSRRSPKFFFVQAGNQLVGTAPLLVGSAFMSAGVLAVVLTGSCFIEKVGGLGGLAVGPGGALVLARRTLVLAATPGTLVIVSTIVGHRKMESTSVEMGP